MNKNKTKKKKFYGEKPKCISYAKLNYLPFSGYFFFFLSFQLSYEKLLLKNDTKIEVYYKVWFKYFMSSVRLFNNTLFMLCCFLFMLTMIRQRKCIFYVRENFLHLNISYLFLILIK